MILAAIIFWTCIFLITHSYVLYPLLLKMLYRPDRKKDDGSSYEPVVHIFMAAYNEEGVISDKLKSIIENDYPKEKLHLWIGSDASTDKTDAIVKGFQEENLYLHFNRFSGRIGKSGILNRLQEQAREQELLKGEDIIILTDANVIFDKKLVKELAGTFAKADIGLVGAYILNTNAQREGISIQEKSYIQRENKIKMMEGEVWGTMMGAFGACYAIRQRYFIKVPPKFLMEDFHISMHVLEQGARAVTNKKAVCYEDVPNRMEEEFKRKVRISAGNFQNLKAFAHLLWPPFKPVAFTFFSHKVIRWFGPVIILLVFFTGLILSTWNEFYGALFLLQILVLALPLLDFLLKKLNIHIIIFRFVSYFYAMNLALLVGFIQFIKGIKTNVWKPTARNQ